MAPGLAWAGNVVRSGESLSARGFSHELIGVAARGQVPWRIGQTPPPEWLNAIIHPTTWPTWGGNFDYPTGTVFRVGSRPLRIFEVGRWIFGSDTLTRTGIIFVRGRPSVMPAVGPDRIDLNFSNMVHNQWAWVALSEPVVVEADSRFIILAYAGHSNTMPVSGVLPATPQIAPQVNLSVPAGTANADNGIGPAWAHAPAGSAITYTSGAGARIFGLSDIRAEFAGDEPEPPTGPATFDPESIWGMGILVENNLRLNVPWEASPVPVGGRVIPARYSGKRYVEFMYGGWGTGIGLVNTSWASSTGMGGGQSAAWWMWNGQLMIGGVGTGLSWSQADTTFAMAVDLDAGRLWYFTPNGWVPGNPHTGEGGANIEGLGTPLQPATEMYDWNSYTRFNFGATPFVHEVPAGFKPWDE